MRRLLPGLLLAIVPAVLCAQVPVPPPPPPAPVGAGMGVPVQGPVRDSNNKLQVPLGTSSIEGTVVGIDTGRPLAGARVSVSGSDMPLNRSLLTDDQGRFSFSQLPAGQFSLAASKARYLQGSYGQKAPDRQGTPIRLGDGQQLKGVSLKLFSGGVITGVVIDEHNDPAMNTQVHVFRYVMRNGVRTLTQSGQTSADDRGVYRFHSLTPGEYIVSATAQNTGMAQSDIASAAIERAISSASAARAAANGSTMPTTGGAVVPAISIDSPYVNGGVSIAQAAPTFYPGTPVASTATTIRVAAGEERSGVDFQLQRIATVTVQGLVQSAAGALPPGLSVQLIDLDPAAANGTSSARVDAEGKFTFRDVAPGQYALVARAALDIARPPVPGAAAPATPAAPIQPKQLFGRTDISVAGDPIGNIVVALDAGRSLSGRVVFDGAAKLPDFTKTRLTASLSPAMTQSGVPSMSASGPVTPDGRFTIDGVQPGHYTLRVSGTQGWYMRSSMLNGQDTLDVPLDVAPGMDLNNAVVTFTDRTTELSGAMTDAQNQPATDYSIIVFPAEQRLWTPSSRRISQTRPATDGRFQFRNLPPGDYYISAVTDVEPGAWYDPEFLRLLVSASARVTLGDGDKKTQDLRVGR